MSRRSIITDFVIAALVTAASLSAVRFTHSSIAPAVITSAPLVARRRYPLAVFLVLLLAVIATRDHATDITVLALIIAGYSAVVHGRLRGAAVLCLPPAALAAAVSFWNAQPVSRHGQVAYVFPTASVPSLPAFPGRIPMLDFGPSFPLRPAALVVVVSLLSIAIVGYALLAGDRLRRLHADHEAATRRAVDLERARIASELHDVVTHNVSVMIVQAGAARQVLAEAPDEARAALLAVESSGRAAMTELRHLLGLLSPAPGTDDGPSPAEDPGGRGADAADLRPQPGLSQLPGLIDRVTAAGLAVEVEGGIPGALPAGLDLAAFRVVQESLTNVIKHAGQSRTRVSFTSRDGNLFVEVADDGCPALGPGPAVGESHGGRGLLGLQERMALYGGELDAGPRPGGGWTVRARFPVGLPAPPPAGRAVTAPRPVAVTPSVPVPAPAPVSAPDPVASSAPAPAAAPTPPAGGSPTASTTDTSPGLGPLTAPRS